MVHQQLFQRIVEPSDKSSPCETVDKIHPALPPIRRNRNRLLVLRVVFKTSVEKHIWSFVSVKQGSDGSMKSGKVCEFEGGKMKTLKVF